MYVQICVGCRNLGGARHAFGGAVHHQATRSLGQDEPHDMARHRALPTMTMSLVKVDNALCLLSIDALPVNHRHTNIALLLHQGCP